ncbi:MAG: CoA ester lyase [Gammaproteobacteria bacterium]
MSIPDHQVRPRRSFIFAPSMRPELYPKALASGADIVCVELEDGVAPKDKDVARQNVLELFSQPQADDGVERMVRINCLRTAVGLKDVQAILDTNSPPPALMLPKVVSPEEVIWLDDLLTEAEKDIRIHIIIEMNEGLEAAFDIAHSSDRIDSLLFGGVDMAADLRCKNAWEPLLYARSRVVHAAASAGIDVIDVPYLDLEDMSGMSREAGLAKDLGFSGKGAIHPKQIAELNRIFTPSDDEISRAKKVISAFDAAESGLVVVDGKLIERPVIREMQRILSIADRASRA